MKYIYIIVLAVMTISCQKKSTEKDSQDTITGEVNEALPGFNGEGSDPEAVIIANQVMEAMGGRQAWDETRYLSWEFFGRRQLLWDKYTGDVRIDYINEDKTILVNIHSLKGNVNIDGQSVSDTDSLASYLSTGKSIWINDSYWLVMPFKLKDSGVSLYYLGSDTTDLGVDAEVLQLTFDQVGDTPDNVYNVWVDSESKLVTQWAFFNSSEDTEPSFITPWSGYAKYDDILLSGGRGKYNLTKIKVLKEVPKDAFTSFEPLSI